MPAIMQINKTPIKKIKQRKTSNRSAKIKNKISKINFKGNLIIHATVYPQLLSRHSQQLGSGGKTKAY